jgi:hypothetical protein
MFKPRGDVEEKGKRALTDQQQTESCTDSNPRLPGAWNEKKKSVLIKQSCKAREEEKGKRRKR